MSPFCLPIVHHRSSARSKCLRIGPQRFCPNRNYRCWALMVMCWNSPLWKRSECCNNLCLRFGCHGSINWTAWSSCDMCVNWNKPSMSHLQLYESIVQVLHSVEQQWWSVWDWVMRTLKGTCTNPLCHNIHWANPQEKHGCDAINQFVWSCSWPANLSQHSTHRTHLLGSELLWCRKIFTIVVAQVVIAHNGYWLHVETVPFHNKCTLSGK